VECRSNRKMPLVAEAALEWRERMFARSAEARRRPRVDGPDPVTVKRSYADELAALDIAYTEAQEADVTSLSRALTDLARRPALFVASGGALVAARLAADLHTTVARQLSRAMTPLELAALPPIPVGTLLLSARARHPDVLLAARAALGAGHNPVGLLTLRPVVELPKSLTSSGLTVISIPGLRGREGFLATTSIITLAVALVRAYLGTAYKLPHALRDVSTQLGDGLRQSVLVLVSPGTEAAAMDLEIRFHELGLRSIQLADFRNFAHGRHLGLARRLSETSIVALVTPEWSSLADATLALLPRKAHVVRLESVSDWPTNTLELIKGSMRIVATAAAEVQIDPAKPSVPRFGRDLYHLSALRRVAPKYVGPVERKLAEAGVSRFDRKLTAIYQEAFSLMLERLREARFLGLILDYDGTCCTTEDRFDLPGDAVQQEVLRLLKSGFTLGFASGRGSSLLRDLRKWIPRKYWPEVHLGLYNGGVALTLDQDLPDQTSVSSELHQAAQRLKRGEFGRLLEFEPRRSQLGVRASGLAIDAVARIATESLVQQPRLPLKVVVSGHAVDIVPEGSSKVALLRRVEARTREGQVLAIGDQGQLGGNDFELLAATESSLSVDRCSADPRRCWNLDDDGLRGPGLLSRYLKNLAVKAQTMRFVWKS
jgi:hydroxymethylpyrimidine pyrophosphatase-like HAD family hydrolase